MTTTNPILQAIEKAQQKYGFHKGFNNLDPAIFRPQDYNQYINSMKKLYKANLPLSYQSDLPTQRCGPRKMERGK